MRIAIVGCPNSGKTTLFNSLTGKNEHVGNWHGVTTDVAVGVFKHKNVLHEVYDLPGINSFDTYTLEENVSRDFLFSKEYDLIVNVIEARRFDAAVDFLEELISLNKPIVVVINMYGDLKRGGGEIDFEKLKGCGVDFFVFEVNSRKGVRRFKELLSDGIDAPESLDKENALNSVTLAETAFSKADEWLAKPIISAAAFFLLVLATFYLAFGNYGIGKLGADLVLNLAEKITEGLKNFLTAKNLSPFVVGLVCQGIVSGVGSVFAFSPPLFVVYFATAYLEQSGLIARFSCLFDGALTRVGLNGRALFALLTGYGCTTLAVLSASGMENQSMKKRLISALPLINCTAKLPVYTYIAQALCGLNGFLLVSVIYLLSTFFTFASLYSQFKLSGEKSVPLIIELPYLRLNCFKNLLKPLIKSVKQFIIKIATVLLCVSIAVYLLNSVHLNVGVAEGVNGVRLLSLIGESLSMLLFPIGIKSSAVGAALFAGVFSKEAILSTLVIADVNISLSWQSAVALSVMISVFPPCLTALDAIRREQGLRFAVKAFAIQTLLGVVLSYITYFTLIRPFVLPLAVCVTLIVKALKRKNESFQRKRE